MNRTVGVPPTGELLARRRSGLDTDVGAAPKTKRALLTPISMGEPKSMRGRHPGGISSAKKTWNIRRPTLPNAAKLRERIL